MIARRAAAAAGLPSPLLPSPLLRPRRPPLARPLRPRVAAASAARPPHPGSGPSPGSPRPAVAASAAAAPPASSSPPLSRSGSRAGGGGGGSGSASYDDGDESCPVFVDREGEFIEAACCDFGFRTGKGRLYSTEYGSIPKSAFELAVENFEYEYAALRRSFREDEYGRIAAQNPPRGAVGWLAYKLGEGVVRTFAAVDRFLEDRQVFSRILPVPVPREVTDPRTGALSRQCRDLRAKIARLTLSNEAVWERERERERAGGGVDTPLVVKVAYYALCLFLDVAFNNRPIQRFWFLETVARVPYFSYISVLHLYETLGWWRAGAELRKVHAAQELNELHHLQLCESLGGDQLWLDRFLAQHSAIAYFVVLLLMYLLSPKLAYNFSELIEAHAVDTYDVFSETNETLLRELPPPFVMAKYYRSADLFYFDEFQTRRRGAEAEAAAALEGVAAAEEAAGDGDGGGGEGGGGGGDGGEPPPSGGDLAAGVPARAGAAETSPRLPPRRPACRNLYDVFRAVSEDESEHVATVAACIDGTVASQLLAKEEERESVQQSLLDRERGWRERRAEAEQASWRESGTLAERRSGGGGGNGRV